MDRLYQISKKPDVKKTSFILEYESMSYYHIPNILIEDSKLFPTQNFEGSMFFYGDCEINKCNCGGQSYICETLHFRNGELHCENGPAQIIIHSCVKTTVFNEYYVLHNTIYSKEDYYKQLKTKLYW